MLCREVADTLRSGNGPALLDIECYRYSGHSTTDTNAYRSRDELKAWQAHDPITRFRDRLIEGGVITAAGADEMAEAAGAQIEAVTRAVVDREIAPAVDLEASPALIGEMTFNNEEIELGAMADDLLADPAGTAAVKSIARKARFGVAEDGSQLSPMRAVTLRDALSEAILHHLAHDSSLIAYGEECRDWGGASGVHRGFADIIPYHRLFNSPISEAAIVSTVVGYALAGGRALIELDADFIGRAGDEISTSSRNGMSAGELRLPVVHACRPTWRSHSQDWTSPSPMCRAFALSIRQHRRCQGADGNRAGGQ